MSGKAYSAYFRCRRASRSRKSARNDAGRIPRRTAVSMNRQPPRAHRARARPDVSRIVTGLWQVADMERDGRALDLDRAAADMAAYAEAGFDAFDMADHYGSAEDIAGRFNALVASGAVQLARGPRRRSSPNGARRPGPMTPRDRARGGRRALSTRLRTPTHRPAAVPLVDVPASRLARRAARARQRCRAKGLIRHLGVTNFDTDHLRRARRGTGSGSPPTRSASRCSTAAPPRT